VCARFQRHSPICFFEGDTPTNRKGCIPCKLKAHSAARCSAIEREAMKAGISPPLLCFFFMVALRGTTSFQFNTASAMAYSLAPI